MWNERIVKHIDQAMCYNSLILNACAKTSPSARKGDRTGRPRESAEYMYAETDARGDGDACPWTCLDVRFVTKFMRILFQFHTHT